MNDIDYIQSELNNISNCLAKLDAAIRKDARGFIDAFFRDYALPMGSSVQTLFREEGETITLVIHCYQDKKHWPGIKSEIEKSAARAFKDYKFDKVDFVCKMKDEL